MANNSVANFISGNVKEDNKVSPDTNVPGTSPKEQKDKKNNPDVNRVANRANHGNSERLNARLELVGMPHIKSKKCLTIENVGEWSGDWYVKSVVHKWSASHGYTTSCSLLREVQE